MVALGLTEKEGALSPDVIFLAQQEGCCLTLRAMRLAIKEVKTLGKQFKKVQLRFFLIR